MVTDLKTTKNKGPLLSVPIELKHSTHEKRYQAYRLILYTCPYGMVLFMIDRLSRLIHANDSAAYLTGNPDQETNKNP